MPDDKSFSYFLYFFLVLEQSQRACIRSLLQKKCILVTGRWTYIRDALRALRRKRASKEVRLTVADIRRESIFEGYMALATYRYSWYAD